MASLANGLSALIRLGASFELDSGVETLSIGCPENSQRDYYLETAGKWLCYRIDIRGAAVLVSASLLDSTGAPQVLLKTCDVEARWEVVFRFLSSLERYEVRNLERPILVGNPVLDDPATCWIIA